MEENNSEKVQEQKGSFWKGFLLGVLAHLANVLLATGVIAIIGMVQKSNDRSFHNFSFFTELTMVATIILLYSAIIWIPLSIVAGFVSKKKGTKRCMLFLAISLAGVLLAFGTCSGVMISLN